MTEIRLSSREKLAVRWLRGEILLLETWTIMDLPDGHGWGLAYQSMLHGHELRQFLDALILPASRCQEAA